jgi:hypothetical protein
MSTYDGRTEPTTFTLDQRDQKGFRHIFFVMAGMVNLYSLPLT